MPASKPVISYESSNSPFSFEKKAHTWLHPLWKRLRSAFHHEFKRLKFSLYRSFLFPQNRIESAAINEALHIFLRPCASSGPFTRPLTYHQPPFWTKSTEMSSNLTHTRRSLLTQLETSSDKHLCIVRGPWSCILLLYVHTCTCTCTSYSLRKFTFLPLL